MTTCQVNSVITRKKFIPPSIYNVEVVETRNTTVQGKPYVSGLSYGARNSLLPSDIVQMRAIEATGFALSEACYMTGSENVNDIHAVNATEFWSKLGDVILPRAHLKTERDLTVQEGMSIADLMAAIDSRQER